nr:uncharacterized protein LOC109151161 [Ipomoea batatas]
MGSQGKSTGLDFVVRNSKGEFIAEIAKNWVSHYNSKLAEAISVRETLKCFSFVKRSANTVAHLVAREAVSIADCVPPETSSPWGVSPVVTAAPTAKIFTNTPSVAIHDAPATESASSQTVSSASASSAPRTSRNKSTNTQRHGLLASLSSEHALPEVHRDGAGLP